MGDSQGGGKEGKMIPVCYKCSRVVKDKYSVFVNLCFTPVRFLHLPHCPPPTPPTSDDETEEPQESYEFVDEFVFRCNYLK